MTLMRSWTRMSRPARIEFPGTVCHAMARGSVRPCSMRRSYCASSQRASHTPLLLGLSSCECSVTDKLPRLRSSHGFVATCLKVAVVARQLHHCSMENPGKLHGRCGIHHVVLRCRHHHQLGLDLFSCPEVLRKQTMLRIDHIADREDGK